jgi:CBS domain containing-hemolysin-like protein
VKRDDGTWLVDGHYSLHDFLTYFDLDELINDYEYDWRISNDGTFAYPKAR